MTQLLRKSGFLLIFIFLLAGLVFSIFYYTAGSDQLASWYLGLGSECFYRLEFWRTEFFTPEVKEQGDKFCLIGIGLCATGIFYLYTRLRSYQPKKTPTVSLKPNLKWYIALVLIALCLGYYSHTKSKPWYDEIFSAVHVSSLHPFQIFSYYMLPNNHPFFNLLNGLIFSFVDDKVLTGRLISVLAFSGLVCITFYWFNHLTRNKWVALAASVVVAVQYPVWGFSTQARGYELQALSGWVLFVSVWRYGESKASNRLWLIAISTFVGYVTVPTFLFFHAAVLTFVFVRHVSVREIDWHFWRSQFAALSMVFLFYLPALCFSGLHALIDNPYVRPETETWESFLPIFAKHLQGGLDYGFGISKEGTSLTGKILTLIPCLLLFTRNPKSYKAGRFYIFLWLSLLVLGVAVKSTAPSRSLIIQHSFTCAFLVLLLYHVAVFVGNVIKRPLMGSYIFFALSGAAMLIFALRHSERVRFLYGPDSAAFFEMNIAGLREIPEGASVAFSYESFYWYYYAKKGDYEVVDCPSGKEEYFVKRTFEPLPDKYSAYQLYRSNEDQYEVYRK